MRKIEEKRLYSLDMLKAVAAFLVCFQHAAGTGILSEYLLAISRIAVPLFMMITGFFYMDVVRHEGEKKQIKKFVVVAIEMTALYFAIDYLNHLISHDLLTYLKSYFSLESIVAFLVFNDPIPADHTWYLWSMIYVLVITYILPKLWKSRMIRTVIIAVSLILLLLLGKYAVLFFGKEIPSTYTRNAWLVGFPYFLLGIFIKENYALIQRMKQKYIIVLVVLSTVFCCIERMILVANNLNASRDSYVFTPVMAVALFILFLTIDVNDHNNLLVNYGIKYSLALYIIHPLFVRFEVKIFNMNSWWQYVGVAMVFVLSSIIAVIWVNCKNKISAHFKL